MKYVNTGSRNWEMSGEGMRSGSSFGTKITDMRETVNFNALRDYRVKRAKDQMKKDGLGAVLMYEPWNIRYTTGYNVNVYARSEPRFYALLPRNGDPYLWVISGLYATCQEEMPWLTKGHIRLCKAPLDWMLTEKKTFAGDWEKEIADILHEHGVNNEPLGLDSVAGGSVFAMQDAMKGVSVKLVDGRQTMLEARKIKNQEEIKLMRIAASISEVCHADARDAIRPGVTERELAGIMLKRMMSMGAEWSEGFVVASGPNTNPNRLGFSDRAIRPGDMIFIDVIGTQYCGYRTCVYRCFTCGKATEEQKEIYQGCYDLLYNAIGKIKAGNTDFDVVSQWPEPEHWGYKPDELHQVRGNAVAHGLGLCQYDLPHISKAISSANPRKLEKGMVIAIETWEGKRGGKQGCRLEEEVVVTRDGYELLTKFPAKELTECWL